MSDEDAAGEPELESLLQWIGDHRGVDFRGYKRSSLRRRIRRRIEEVGLDGFQDYQARLAADQNEFVQFLDTVLINVTAFFRDPEAWEALRRDVIPGIVARAVEADRPIRIWSVGCATGQEPFGLAMAFAEAMGTEEFCRRVKIHATDLDEEALRIARGATYAPRDVEGVPPGLLERYFERHAGRFVFGRALRQCVTFGRHNAVHDAPIGRIDLLVCRNLLIYLDGQTQQAVLARLHYALTREGVLFLGKAETQLARSRLFEPADLRHRLFRKVPQEWPRAGILHNSPTSLDSRTGPQLRLLGAVLDGAAVAHLALGADDTLILANASARRLLDLGDADIGSPVADLAVSYRPVDLRALVEQAHRLGRAVRLEHQHHHRPPAEPMRLTVEVTPLLVSEGRRPATLVTFADTTRLFTLEQDLETARESLETTVEELQSANEELETTNEELQSTNEELETTNEEMQSTNEELETTNEEMRASNDALEEVNKAMQRRDEDAEARRHHADAVLRAMDAGVLVTDERLLVRAWNRWNENAWGLRVDEVLGRELLTLDIGLPLADLRDDLGRVLSGDMPLAEAILEGHDRRGRPVRCRIRLSPLVVEGQVRGGVVMVVLDA